MGPSHNGVEDPSLHAGVLLRRHALSQDAIYRVLRKPRGRVVDVQVIVAPGLEPGTRLTLTTTAASAMRAAPGPSIEPVREGQRRILHNPRPVPPSKSKPPEPLLLGRLRPGPGRDS